MTKIGFISFAHHHAYSYAASLKSIADVEIAGVYDDNSARGVAAATQYQCPFYADLDALLATDVEAVVICSENVHHKEHVLKAAAAQKNILCEKPIATSKADAIAMIEACNEFQVLLEIAFPVRFCQSIQAAKGMLESGRLGKLQAIRTSNRGQNPMGWFVDPALSGGGSVIDHTVHMVDIVRWLTGQEIVSVDAEIDRFFKDTAVEDAGILNLTLTNGVIMNHDCSWSRCDNFPTWGDIKLELFGTKGNLRVDVTNNMVACYQDEGKPAEQLFLGNNMDLGLMQNFVDILRGEKQPFITGEDGLRALEVGLAAYAANARHQTVRLNE